MSNPLDPHSFLKLNLILFLLFLLALIVNFNFKKKFPLLFENKIKFLKIMVQFNAHSNDN